MIRASFTRPLLVLFVLLGLTVLVFGATAAAQAPDFEDRVPRESPLGPLDPARYMPTAQQAAAESQVSPYGPYDMDWSRIAFESFRNKHDYDIYYAAGSGNGLRQVTFSSAHDIHAKLNRGGDKIAFASGRDGNWNIWRIDASGANLIRLTSHGSTDVYPSWSPDGRQIAFTSKRDGQYEIYVMNANGGGLKRLTSHGAYDGEPAWSPDGQHIAFVSDRSGSYRIWVMNADGSGATRISNEPGAGRPAWSPDSQRILYHADGNGDTWYDLYVVNANGSGRITARTGYGSSSSGRDFYAASWSPDGRWIAYTAVDWIYYKGSWYWQYAYPYYGEPASGYGQTWNSSWSLEWNLDWQTADLIPPSSQVFPLPAYANADVEVKWTAEDQGGSKLEEVLVQYRLGEAGSWTFLEDSTESYYWHKTVTKDSGETVYFRSRATDRAGNVEAWPADGHDTRVTFYDWLLQGRLNDNRGQPVAGAAVIDDPVLFENHPSDAEGYYRAYYAGTEYAFTPAWGRADYGELPETTFRSDSDRWFEGVLPPKDNQVADWGFEAQALDSGGAWQTGGTVSPTLSLDEMHTGQAAVFMGLPFDLQAPTTLRHADSIQQNPLLAADDSGALHLLWKEAGGWEQVLYYAHKPAGGAWSEPVALNGAGSNIQNHLWAVTPDGRVHVVWDEYDYPRDTIHHIWRSPAGVWSASQIVHSDGRCSLLDLEVADGGQAHLLWQLTNTDNNDTYYSRASATGDWDSPIPTNVPYDWGIDDLALGPDGRAHLLWRYSGDDIYYSYLQPNDTWSTREHVFPGGYNWYLDLAIDSTGQTHVVWANVSHGKVYHRWRAVNGQWSDVVELSAGTSPNAEYYGYFLDSNDTLHVIWPGGGDYACRLIYYVRRPVDGNWSTPMVASGEDGCYGRAWLQESASEPVLLFHSPLREQDHFCLVNLGSGDVSTPTCVDNYFDEYPAVEIDPSGVIHTVWRRPAEGGGQDLSYAYSKLAEADAVSSISQQVTIPVTLTNPTLSLMVALQGGRADSGAGMVAQVQGEGYPAIVLEADASTGWTHAWADLTPWAGQTVSLTISARQVTGEPQVGLLVDEVSLGSAPPDLWLDLHGPPNVPTGETFDLVLHYGNCMPSAVGGVQISLTLPAELSFVSAVPAPDVASPALIWDVADFGDVVEERVIVLTVTMDADFAPDLWAAVIAEVHGASPELEMANNQYEHDIRVGYVTDLPLIAR